MATLKEYLASAEQVPDTHTVVVETEVYYGQRKANISIMPTQTLELWMRRAVEKGTLKVAIHNGITYHIFNTSNTKCIGAKYNEVEDKYVDIIATTLDYIEYKTFIHNGFY